MHFWIGVQYLATKTRPASDRFLTAAYKFEFCITQSDINKFSPLPGFEPRTSWKQAAVLTIELWRLDFLRKVSFILFIFYNFFCCLAAWGLSYRREPWWPNHYIVIALYQQQYYSYLYSINLPYFRQIIFSSNKK